MHLLAFSGSPSAGAVAELLRAAVALLPAKTMVTFYDGIGTLPLFTPALTAPGLAPPPAVAALHRQLAAADVVLFATPEYAYGLPGSFKNALDWLVGAGSLYGKPTGALSASPSAEGGRRALASLLLTLEALGANVPAAATLVVPLVRTRLDPATGAISDPLLTQELRTLLDACMIRPPAADQGPGWLNSI